MANGCKANSFSKLSNATESLFLLLRTSQLLLNTVEKGVLYISHILSKNNIEVGDLDDTMSRSVSWASESSSAGNRSQHLSVEDMMEVSRSVSSYRNGLGVILYSRGNMRSGRYLEERNVALSPLIIVDRTSLASSSIHILGS